jgi:pimeloyl-ACP methyl ester carboxylesterase
VQSMTNGERLYPINDVELCVETFGDPAAPAILFVDGASASMLWWDAALCERIAAGGRFVIRYDNRDTGRSTCYPPGSAPYTFSDLARDAAGVLDAVGVDTAHVVGRSWGGGIVLALCLEHRERVATLTLVSTSTGAPGLPPPVGEFMRHVPPDPDPTDHDAVVEYIVGWSRAVAGGSALFDEAATRALVERDLARTRDVASMLVNPTTAKVDPDHDFAAVDVPTLVVHGDHDALLPLAHGEALRDTIRGAELLVLPGAGHDLPRPVWDTFVAALLGHTA